MLILANNMVGIKPTHSDKQTNKIFAVKFCRIGSQKFKGNKFHADI